MNDDSEDSSVVTADLDDKTVTIDLGKMYQDSYDKYLSTLYGNLSISTPSTTMGVGGTYPYYTTSGYSLGTYAASPWTVGANQTTNSGTLHISGDNPDIMLGDKSMAKWMESVNARLHILEPKKELLEKYDALKQAYEHYKTLEALLHENDNES